MILLIIGYKYCGGCNPRYDRKKFVLELVKNVKENYMMELVKENKVYDYVLVVCGCTVCCASTDNIKFSKELIRIDCDSKLNEVLENIEQGFRG